VLPPSIGIISQGGPINESITGNIANPLNRPITISAVITTKKYLTTKSNSEKASIMIPRRVLSPPWITGTNICSKQEAIRSFLVPREVRKASTTWAVNSTPMPTAVINVTAEMGLSFTSKSPMKPAN